MATFDSADITNRLRSLFPKRWAGSNGWNDGTDGNPTGRLYALTYAVASSLSYLMLYTWPFVRTQTRLATVQDEYADLAWRDFYGSRYGRNVGESNLATTTRLRQKIIAKTGVKNGVLNAVQLWFSQNPDGSTSQDVFDRQTDPDRAAYYGIQDAQFAVIIYYPENTVNPGFFVGQSFVGQDFLSDPYAFSASHVSPYPGLEQVVNDSKDLGYRPVYVTSHGENPDGSGWGTPWSSLVWNAT